jgi:membrane protein YqaA with SNARE-associated domain
MLLQTKLLRTGLFLTLIVFIVGGSFWVTKLVEESAYIQTLVREFGTFGVLLVSFVAGLNAFLPVPAATFVPIFTASGMSIMLIITLLVIGTMAANLFAYGIGRFGQSLTSTHYPKIQTRLITLYQTKKAYLPYFIFLFTALVPLPDEVFLIPLGIIGVKIRHIIFPLLLGTIAYQSITAFGFDNVFKMVSGLM